MMAAAATLGAGAISTAGQLYANQKNLDYTKWKNNVDYAIAQQNNATQINMANTAHQREVADLRAAGLNPILSAGGSGASTPQLRSSEMGTFQTDNPVSGLGQSAKQAATYLSDQYKLQNDALAQSNMASATENQLLFDQIDRGVFEQANTADFVNSKADSQEALNRLARAQMETAALNTLESEQSSRKRSKWVAGGRFYELTKEGVESDLKMRSNQNWRANLSSFVPFTSPAAINSGANSARQVQSILRHRNAPRWLP